MLAFSRYLAIVFAIGLAIGEAVINWGDWQFAPLWIIDYVIVAALLAGAYRSRARGETATLQGAWALTAGVFYMALFVSLEPQIRSVLGADPIMLGLIGFMLLAAVAGWACAALARK